MTAANCGVQGQMPDETRVGVYVVGFFDILGQANALKPFIDVRDDANYLSQLQRELTRTINQLTLFRRDITRYFEAAIAVKLTENVPAGVTAEEMAMAADFESPQIRIQGFSDTIVVYVPLASPSGRLSLYGMWPLLFSVVNTMLTSFARGFAVRGAIDASWGTEPFAGEFYGPALLSAYGLETTTANWSRVVLGPGLRRLLNLMSRHSPQSPPEGANVALAQITSKWAFTDIDDTVAIDYLNPSMLELIEERDFELATLIDAAHVQLERLLEASPTERIREIIGGALNYFVERRGPLTAERRNRAANSEFLRRPSQ
jgi:hypothetical protein